MYERRSNVDSGAAATMRGAATTRAANALRARGSGPRGAWAPRAARGRSRGKPLQVGPSRGGSSLRKRHQARASCLMALFSFLISATPA